MFGFSNPFLQPSFSSFGAQTAFGQTNAANTNNPYAPKPFGSTSPFGSQTGGSLFGGTAFGTSSVPAFGSTSTPAFGASSTHAYGFTSTPFGTTSPFGLKFAFRGFGSPNPTQSIGSSAFGSTSMPAFGAFTPTFGASSGPAFGAYGAPAFGASSSPAFGASSTPAFGASSTTPSFGFGAETTKLTFGGAGFGQTPFGVQHGGSRASTIEDDGGVGGQEPGKVISISDMPQYKEKSHEEVRWRDYQLGDKVVFEKVMFGGFGQKFAFGGFGSPNPTLSIGSSIDQMQPTFGSQPFVANSTPAFGASTPTFGASSGPAFGAYGAPAFGASSSPAFGASSTPAFGASSTTPSFGFGSISAVVDSSVAFGSGSTPAFGSTPSPFGAQSSIFGAELTTPTFGGASFGQTPGKVISIGWGNYQSDDKAEEKRHEEPGWGDYQLRDKEEEKRHEELGWGDYQLGNKDEKKHYEEPGWMDYQWGAKVEEKCHEELGCGDYQMDDKVEEKRHEELGWEDYQLGGQNSSFVSSLFPSSTSSMMSQNQPAGLGQSMPSMFGGFQTSTPAQTQSAFSFGNFGQTQPAFGQTSFGQLVQQNVMVMTQPPVSNPFGTLPAMPQMSIGRSAGSASVQYGISNMPVNEKPAQVRTTSLLTSHHITRRSRFRMHSRRYNPKKDSPKVAFFIESEEAPSTPRTDAMFIPRENPRALFIRPIDQSPVSKSAANMKEMAIPVNDHDSQGNWPCGMENANFENNSSSSKLVDVPLKSTSRHNGLNEEHNHKGNDYISNSGHRAGEAAIVYYEHGADIEALMPKLRHSDYYTEPKIQDLAAKEREEPGYCRRVKDFVVGRKGYGFVKFFGETDASRLDLLSIIQFNKCEVLVYMDESKKPPPGQGLNKPAELTLLNVKCTDKKTGQHYAEGPQVEKFERRLKKMTEDQGAEFVLYNASKGEWKFRVNAFDQKRRHSHHYTENLVYMDESKKTPSGQGLNKSAELTLLNVKCADKKRCQHYAEGPEVEQFERRCKKKTEDHYTEPTELTLLNVKCADKKRCQHYVEGSEIEKFERRCKKKTEDHYTEQVAKEQAEPGCCRQVKDFVSWISGVFKGKTTVRTSRKTREQNLKGCFKF